MDYSKLVESAGFKPPKADYITRKLEEKGVKAHKLESLPNFFKGANELAGVPIAELAQRLHTAHVEVDATDAAKELADQNDVVLTEVKGTGKKGRVTKSDVESAVED